MSVRSLILADWAGHKTFLDTQISTEVMHKSYVYQIVWLFSLQFHLIMLRWL